MNQVTERMTQSRGKMIFLLLISVMFLFLIYFFKEKIGNTLIFWIAWLFMSILASLIVENLTGKITIKNKEIKATGGLAVFVILISTGFAIFKMEDKFFTLTVFLRNEKRDPVHINGVIRLIIDGNPREEEIDKYGSAIFKNTPVNVLGKEIFVELIDNTKWVFVNNRLSATEKLVSNNTVLFVKQSGNQCCIVGNVVDITGKSVKNALVWTDTLTPVITNGRGIFVIRIPVSRQEEENFMITVKKDNVEENAIVNRIQKATIKLKTVVKHD